MKPRIIFTIALLSFIVIACAVFSISKQSLVDQLKQSKQGYRERELYLSLVDYKPNFLTCGMLR